MNPIRRILCKVEYDGSTFRGWQLQEDVPSVQEEIQKVLFKILREEVELFAPSRTDAGVHARGQLFTFDTTTDRPLSVLYASLNSLLPHSISIQQMVEVPNDYFPRNEAQGKRYRYQIQNTPYPPALERNHCWWIRSYLDLEAMQASAQHFLGEHDFSCFQGRFCTSKTTIKLIQSVAISTTPLHLGQRIEVVVEGKGFLKNQIRLMVGALVQVGKARMLEADIKKAVQETCELPKPLNAPAQGLCLEEVYLDPNPFVNRSFPG